MEGGTETYRTDSIERMDCVLRLAGTFLDLVGPNTFPSWDLADCCMLIKPRIKQREARASL